MTKNEIINDIVSSLVMTLTKEQLEIVKSTFIVKMQGYDIHEVCTLPSVEVLDNEFIFKRFGGLFLFYTNILNFYLHICKLFITFAA